MQYAEVAELADAQASGACGSNTVWVQVPSSALETKRASHLGCFFCFQEAAPLEPWVQGLAFGSVGAKQVPLAPSAPSSASKGIENSLPIKDKFGKMGVLWEKQYLQNFIRCVPRI